MRFHGNKILSVVSRNCHMGQSQHHNPIKSKPLSKGEYRFGLDSILPVFGHI
ncbi:hypothetical protein SLEP1_g38522 [Rubroshorea leprosula]|nr:hypothetical protein SLEP1_g38522 [Rubroshorea leprosula]